MGLVNYGRNLPEDNLTLPELAKKAGYSKHLIGLSEDEIVRIPFVRNATLVEV
jgi:hypothetical protein